MNFDALSSQLLFSILIFYFLFRTFDIDLIFRNFKITNITIANDDLFDYFIYEFIFYYFSFNYLNT